MEENRKSLRNIVGTMALFSLLTIPGFIFYNSAKSHIKKRSELYESLPEEVRKYDADSSKRWDLEEMQELLRDYTFVPK